MMTWTERLEFEAFCNRFPIDDEANFQRPAAMLAAMYANAHRKEGAQSVALTAFMPFYERPEGADDEFDIEDVLNG